MTSNFSTPRRLLLSLLIVSALPFAGCSSSGAGKDGMEGDGSLSESDLNAQREGRFGSGSIPSAEGEGLFRDIHFDYDSTVIDDGARQDIEYNAQVLEQNPSMSVSLEGHCDERGTNEYNMALGAERARAVKGALLAFGISGTRVETISYGEEVPLDPSQNEDAFAKNRRVHFSGSGGPQGSR